MGDAVGDSNIVAVDATDAAADGRVWMDAPPDSPPVGQIFGFPVHDLTITPFSSTNGSSSDPVFAFTGENAMAANVIYVTNESQTRRAAIGIGAVGQVVYDEGVSSDVLATTSGANTFAIVSLTHTDPPSATVTTAETTTPSSPYQLVHMGTGYGIVGFLGNYSLFITALDSSGGLNWAKQYGQSLFIPRATGTADGGLVAVGPYGPVNGAYIVRVDGSGAVVCAKYVAAGGAPTNLDNVRAAADGTMVVIGYTQISSANEIFAAKLASDCSVIWQKTYGGSYGFDVDIAGDGHYIVAAGTTTGVALLELDPNDGSVLQQHAFARNTQNHIITGRKLADGTYALAVAEGATTWIIHTDNQMAATCTGAASSLVATTSSVTFTDATLAVSDVATTVAPATVSATVDPVTPSMDCSAF